jgi:predicted transposase YbfD/YdcC
MGELDGYRQLYALSAQVEDWRSDLGKRHQLTEVIFIMVVALIAGAQNCEDIHEFAKDGEWWLRQFLTLKHGIPHHDMYLRTLAAVPAEQFEALVRAWSAALRAPGALTVDGSQVAFDGQALRATVDRAAGQSPVHMVSAYLIEAGFTLGTKRAEDKSNEITAIPELMRSLNLRGATVTIDAMGCQRDIAATAREVGAHDQLQAKKNQPTLMKNIRDSMAEATRRRRPGEAPAPKLDRHRDVDKGHGRIETRVCSLSRDLSGIENAEAWRDLNGIASVLRERVDVISGKTSKEINYYIISDPKATARDVERLARGHWGIENGLHWSMDVVWGSDAHAIRDRNAAENMARLRRFCAGMIKRSVGWGLSQRRLRLSCGWNPNNILRVLRGDVIEHQRTKVMPVKMRKAREAARTVAKKK